jgi:hypothetical protein
MKDFSFYVCIEVFFLNITNPHYSLNVHIWIISALCTSGIVEGCGPYTDLVR